MTWIDDYKAKRCTAAEAVCRIKSGDRVYYAGNAAIPDRTIATMTKATFPQWRFMAFSIVDAN